MRTFFSKTYMFDSDENNITFAALFSRTVVLKEGIENETVNTLWLIRKIP